jgi:hypothetical protein
LYIFEAADLFFRKDNPTFTLGEKLEGRVLPPKVTLLMMNTTEGPVEFEHKEREESAWGFGERNQI